MADIFYQIANTHRNQEYFFFDVKEKHFKKMWPSYWERHSKGRQKGLQTFNTVHLQFRLNSVRDQRTPYSTRQM